MKLDKRSEFSKNISGFFRKLLIVIGILGSITTIGYYYFFIIKGFTFTITNDMREGGLGWFIRIIEEDGWLIALLSLVFVFGSFLTFTFDLEQRAKKRAMLRELEHLDKH